MENYFILLGLSFNPIENNEEIIKEAIEKKREQWQKEAKNPRKQVQAKENLSKIPEIESIMLNPAKRKLEAEKAFHEQEKYVLNLKNEILILSIKGFITDEEFEQLINKYEQFSITKKEIENFINVPIGEEQELVLTDIDSINAETASQLETYFENLGMNDISIYNLYNISPNCLATEVINAANLKLKQLLEKGSKDNKDEMEQKIAGLIINIFKDDKTKYDNYLRGFRFIKLNKLIETALSSQKVLTLHILKTFVDICDKEYNFKTSQTYDYVVTHCNIKGYEVSQDVLIEVMTYDETKEEKPKEVIKEVIIEKEPEFNTKDMINQMINPLHNLLVNNKNKINQISNYLNQYLEKRYQTGAAMSGVLSYGSFICFGVFSIIDIFLYFSKFNNIGNPLILMFLLIGILCNIFGSITIYPAFSKWNKMVNCVKKTNTNNKSIEDLYNKFIELNFNLLVDDNKNIKNTLNNIQKETNRLLKDSTYYYETYTNLSKTYVQKEYYVKTLLLSIALHVGIIACGMFF